jgi:hypothetical protein
VHELKSKKLGAVSLELNFEKAYDRVNWRFLQEVLLRKGFESRYTHKIMHLVIQGKTTISIKSEVGPFFRNKHGVCQGDPISRLLFHLMVDALAALISKC